MFSGIYDLTIVIIQALQNIGDWFIAIMNFFSFLGGEMNWAIVPVLIWTLDYNFGLRIGVILLLNSGLNGILKVAFAEPRPFWVSNEISHLYKPETNFGVPSGHAMTPASIFGYVAATFKRAWVTIVMVIIIFFIGVSRLALGVHFLQDVLVGWAFGLIFLWLFVRYEDTVKGWFGKLTMGAKVGTVFLISIAMILLGVLVITLRSGYEVPQAYQANIELAQPGHPVTPFSLDGTITSAATLFGLAVGAFWVEAEGGFDDTGKPWQRIIRFLIGLVGIIILWMGLGEVFPGEHDLLSYSLSFVRYALIGLWITGLAPLLFIKLKLAGK